jgi:hypothetical protein
MFDKKPIESVDHKNLPKPYKPDELQKLNEAREIERAAAAKTEAAPEPGNKDE